MTARSTSKRSRHAELTLQASQSRLPLQLLVSKKGSSRPTLPSRTQELVCFSQVYRTEAGSWVGRNE